MADPSNVVTPAPPDWLEDVRDYSTLWDADSILEQALQGTMPPSIESFEANWHHHNRTPFAHDLETIEIAWQAYSDKKDGIVPSIPHRRGRRYTSKGPYKGNDSAWDEYNARKGDLGAWDDYNTRKGEYEEPRGKGDVDLASWKQADTLLARFVPLGDDEMSSVLAKATSFDLQGRVHELQKHTPMGSILWHTFSNAKLGDTRDPSKVANRPLAIFLTHIYDLIDQNVVEGFSYTGNGTRVRYHTHLGATGRAGKGKASMPYFSHKGIDTSYVNPALFDDLVKDNHRLPDSRRSAATASAASAATSSV